MTQQLNTHKKTLNQKEIKQIKKDFLKMYFALTAINWAHKMTLGMARQKALEQMRAFVESKMKIQNHPLNKHLIQFHNEFRRNMSKHIMTSGYSEKKLNPELAEKLIRFGTIKTKEAKSGINSLYQKYMPKQNAKPIEIKKFIFIKQNIKIQPMILQNMARQRAA
jgi:hypothetical protein